MFEKGFFGGLFDFNKDGKLDPIEMAMDFATFADLTSDEDEDEDEEYEDEYEDEYEENEDFDDEDWDWE